MNKVYTIEPQNTNTVVAIIARKENRIPAMALGGWPLGEARGGGVDPLPAGGGGLVDGGIGPCATSSSIKTGLGAWAGGINWGVMIENNWPGAAGAM